jgi:ABC-type multidrug transport system fused ATPase/permease subunit
MATHRKASARRPARPGRAPRSARVRADLRAADDTTLFPVVRADPAAVEAAPARSVRAIFGAFWPDTRSFRGRLLLSLPLVGVPPLLSGAGIYLFKVLVDDVLTPRNLELFPLVAAAFVAVTVAEGAVSFADEYLTAWVAERFVLVLRTRVFDHLQRLSLTFFQRHQAGDVLTRLTGDVSAIEELMLSGLNQALTYAFQAVFFAGALFILDWRLAGAALIAAPGFLLLARFFSRRIKNASRERRRRSGSIAAVAEESLHNVALVQAYNQQERESQRFSRESLGSFTAQLLATKLEALFAPFTDLMQTLGVLAVVGLGIRELIAGRLTLGGLLVFLGYLSQLYGPITGFGHLVNSIYAASAGAERVMEILRSQPEVRDPSDPVTLRRPRGELRVERLGFHYPGSSRSTLANISFSVFPGETVAVVGASGAGKSTLLRLLLRLHDPTVGAVSLDGVDIRRLRLAELRNHVAVVLQETLVFDGTVAENIRWGRQDATAEQVREAARAADADQFITGLPQGYQTRIGQRGMMLSGGQRQRIALARAIIRDAPVLLLDEPTTGLDAASAQRVLEPLRRAMRGRTTVVISHNLLTVTDADRILYLEEGRVAGYGPHAELLHTCRGYAELYRMNQPDRTFEPVAPRSRRAAPALPPLVPAAPVAAPSPAPAVVVPRQRTATLTGVPAVPSQRPTPLPGRRLPRPVPLLASRPIPKPVGTPARPDRPAGGEGERQPGGGA